MSVITFKIKVFFFLSCSLFTVAGFPQAETSYLVPVNEFGHPDLQGVWTDQSMTPLERPDSLGLKSTYTLQEIRNLEQARQVSMERAQEPLRADRSPPPIGGAITQQSDVNFNGLVTRFVPVLGDYLTSRIVQPKSGRLPYLDENPQDIFARRANSGFTRFDGPENRPANERCLGVPGQLPLIVQLPLDGPWRNIQIVQNENYVMIYGEYHTSPRIVRLNSQHFAPAFPKFFGDSVGFWEGDTLVVHTMSFKPDQSNRRLRSSESLEVIERYTPVSDSEIVLEFEIMDPKIYSEAIKSRLTLQRMRSGQRLYESGCHEGNYSLPSILAGARRQEAESRLTR
jgi:hypothetical protein